MQILDKVKEFVKPIIEQNNYYLLEITYKRKGGKLALRLTLDKEGGISLEECAKVNTQISEFLEKENIILDPYTVEVDSPGLDRRLRTENDFTWAMGKTVKVSIYEPINGQKIFLGKLIGMNEQNIIIEENGVAAEINKEKIANAKVKPDINWTKKGSAR